MGLVPGQNLVTFQLSGLNVLVREGQAEGEPLLALMVLKEVVLVVEPPTRGPVSLPMRCLQL